MPKERAQPVLKVVGGEDLPASTKDRIVDAAFSTLKEEGFAGTSARAIARRGGFNQALIFYHFGTLNDLLLATLDKTSADRMSRYRDSIGKAKSVDDKIQTATRLYREDLVSGHITVISEMVAGSLARPDLGPEVVARMEPWIAFTEGVISDLVTGSIFESAVNPRTLAFAVVALYLGVDLLSHLDQDKSRAEALFQLVGTMGPFLAPIFGND
ncbi:MAG TPA: TetR/AcrR family transcriptional regulator [Actinomycetota bacterium]|nr:TetR/AcrR family transcriptional regulator [Actinomycetota bacterium]